MSAKFCSLVFLGPVLASQCLFAVEESPPVLQSIPQTAAVVVNVSRPEALLDPALKLDFAQLSDSLTGGRPNPKLQEFRGVIGFLEGQLGTDWRAGLRQLIGHGLTLAVQPGGGASLTLDGQDEKLLASLHDIIRQFAAGDAEKQGQPERVAMKEYKGAKTWSFGPKEAHVLLGPRLVVANGRSVLESILDQKAEGKTSIAASPLFQAAQAALGKEAVASVYLDLRVLGQIPGVKKALADGGNPLGMLFLADTKEALRHATWFALGIYVREDRLSLKTFTDGKPPEAAKSASFTQPRGPDEGILPNLRVPREIAALSLCRDLRTFYAAKDDLFPERTSGLVFFENMMGIFFSGIELTEGVLAQFRPDLRVVVAAQKYDSAAGIPAVQVPAFAAVLRLRHADKFGDTVEEAWQKALGLVNFTRGQKALPGLVIDRGAHADVKYTVSYYRPPDEKDKSSAEIRYNYRPSLARPGDYVVISSTDGLARDLIDALKKESAGSLKPSQAAHTSCEVDGRQLRTILEANREHLIRNNMVEKGNSREQAENQIATLLTLIDCLDKAKLSISRENQRPGATLELKLKAPSAKPAKTEADNGSIKSVLKSQS